MKPTVRSFLVLILVFVLSFNMSCDILTPLDPDLKAEKEAWDVIIEAHALKQLWFHHFFRINSNNFTQGQFFLYEPTDTQIDFLLNEFEHLMSYADDVFAAVDSLENLSENSLGKPAVSSSIFGALKSFFTEGKETFTNYRKRTVYIASKMSKQERDNMYYDIVSAKWQEEIGDADAFWDKFQKGELDDKAQTIYRDFYDDVEYSFGTTAIDYNLTPAHCINKDGINLCNKGFDVVLETGKILAPGLGEATDLLDAGKDFCEKAEKMVDKPLEFIADEVKSRAAQKVVGMTSVGEFFNADGIGTYVKILAETSLGSDDPQELVEKGIDYGIAKITSTDASVSTDIAIAKNQQSGPGLPEFIIGVGTYARQANEFLLTLPSGDWGITSRENSGQTSTTTTATVTTQQTTTVDVIADTSSTPEDSTGTPSDTTIVLDPQIERLDEIFDSLGVMPDKAQEVVINILDRREDGRLFREYMINGSTLSWVSAIYALKWNKYSFSSNYTQEDIHTSSAGTNLYRGSANISGSIYLDAARNTPLLSISAHFYYYRYKGITDDVMVYKEERQIDVDDLPLDYAYHNCDYYLFCSSTYENSAINGLAIETADKYCSGQIDKVRYDTTGTIDYEHHHNYIQDPEFADLGIRFFIIDTSSTNYNILYDY